MLRILNFAICLLFISAFALNAAIWPDHFWGFDKTSSRPATLPDPALWNEYGLQESEQTVYQSSGDRFTATAYRFSDPTGALAAFQWLRPADAKPLELRGLAVEAGGRTLFAYGNYLIEFEGRKPDPKELEPLIAVIPRLDLSPLPALKDDLPQDGLVPNSERFVTGPVSLERFYPRVPPSVAGFHYGVEAQVGTFHTSAGELPLAVFSYPTPQIARERLAEFEKLSGAVVKRSGPLLAVVFAGNHPDAAERLLSAVRYQANLTWNETAAAQPENIGTLILHIMLLIGLLLAVSVALGFAFGGLRVFRHRWLGNKNADEAMITLHLGDR